MYSDLSVFKNNSKSSKKKDTMIDYSHVLPDSPLLKQIETLYVGSFPPVERRRFESVRKLLEKENVPFHIIAATEGSELVGFLSYWDFSGFRYIEHFAVDVRKRGNGIGSGILEYFITDCDKLPVVLEVELPESYDARRRVDFYMRHSFIIWKLLKYIQPPYEKGNDSLEMKLMTLRVNDKNKVAEMAKIIQREVYKPIEQY